MGHRRRCVENVGFRCAQCGRNVKPLTNGSYRNHCPFCLWSRHVDHKPGDRANSCGGLMEPIGVQQSSHGKGMQIVHQCVRCRVTRVNRVALNTDQPDDTEQLIAIMATTC